MDLQPTTAVHYCCCSLLLNILALSLPEENVSEHSYFTK
jgi:hypothetical protein